MTDKGIQPLAGMRSPLIGYYGGKGRMAAEIADIIQQQHWRTYVEAFVGGASVFYRLDKTPQKDYMLNDKDSRIINFWQVVQNKPDELIRFIDSRAVASRELHLRARQYFVEAQGIDYSTHDIELAWALWYLLRTSFSGKFDEVMRRAANCCTKNINNIINSKADLPQMVQHIQFALIDKDDACAVIVKYDSPATMFYLDPPYVDAFQAHYGGYMQADFDRLLDVCAALQGKFVLSHYDNPQLTERAAKQGWHIIRREIFCSVSSAGHTQRTELLCTNFQPGGGLL